MPKSPSQTSDSPRRAPGRLVATVVAATLIGLATPPDVDAQVVLTPRFSVANSGVGDNPNWIFVGNDAAADTTGNVLFFWSEVLPSTAKPPRALGSRLWSTGGSGPYARLTTDEFIREPHVAARPFGGFVTTWQSNEHFDTSRVLARFLDAAGQPTGEIIDVGAEGVPFGSSHSVVGVPAGAAFAWYASSPNEVHGRLFLSDGRPTTPEFTIGTANSFPAVGMAALPLGSFVVGWTSAAENPRGASAGRVFSAAGSPLGEPFVFSAESFFLNVAASPAGDVVAVLSGRSENFNTAPKDLWIQRTTLAGAPLESEILVASGDATSSMRGDLAFDLNGNLYVIWTDVSHGFSPILARGYDRNGQPLGPAVTIDTDAGAYSLRALRLPDGNFFNGLGRYGAKDIHANITSLCTPGTSVCGDGVSDPLCEQCDDGALNSDATPDACRTNCRPAQCGDGVTDAGETCDDGNRTSCDGCSRDCAVESGLGCGDGVAYPACGELCDDGNAIDGDGCSTACDVERVPGGGSPGSDCHAEWSVDNAANAPRFDKLGRFSDLQTCTDNDPRCDFDGGVAGSCSFAVAICVNNTNLPACEPEFRLRSWELRKPSTSRAAHDPAAAAIRNAFQAVVPGTVVGPDARDLCSPRALVPLPLKGSAAHPKKNKLALVARAALYSGATDTDKLRLVCLPPSP